MSGTSGGPRRPPELEVIHRSSAIVPGHKRGCAGTQDIHIRHVEGKYRIALTCACGALRELDGVAHGTFAEANNAARLAEIGAAKQILDGAHRLRVIGVPRGVQYNGRDSWAK